MHVRPCYSSLFHGYPLILQKCWGYSELYPISLLWFCRNYCRSRSFAGETDFSRANFVALDEWLDLEDESENCTAFMVRNFYGPLHIEDNRIHLFDIHAENLEDGCKKIDRFIFENHGIDRRPCCRPR